MGEASEQERDVKEDRVVWRLPQEINDTRSTNVCMVGVKWIVRRYWRNVLTFYCEKFIKITGFHFFFSFYRASAKIVCNAEHVRCCKFEYYTSAFCGICVYN
jgi:hypothetical protein